MKFLAPLFAFFALAIGSASAQYSPPNVNLTKYGITIGSPTQGQTFNVKENITVQINSTVCFVSLFVAYTLSQRLKLINPLLYIHRIPKTYLLPAWSPYSSAPARYPAGALVHHLTIVLTRTTNY